MGQSDASKKVKATAANASDASGAGPGRDSATIMKGVVIFLGVLLILGFVALLSTIVYRSVKLADGKATGSVRDGFGAVDVNVAADAAVTGIDVDGNRMAVHMRGADGEEIMVFDIRRGQLLGRVRLKRR